RLHHLAAALGASPVRAQHRDADDQVADRPIPRPQGAERIRGDDPAQGRFLRLRRVQRQPLPVLRELGLQARERQAGFGGGHPVPGPGVDHPVPPGGRELPPHPPPRGHPRRPPPQQSRPPPPPAPPPSPPPPP